MNTYIPIPSQPKQGSPPNPRRSYRLRQGFTLIELLIVLVVIGVLAFLTVPILVRAREVATDNAAQQYAHNVYKAAQAYIAETAATTVPTDCSTILGYTAGNYGASQFPFILTCSVLPSGSKVSVTYTGGISNAFTLGE